MMESAVSGRAAKGRRTGIYLLQNYFMKNGTQPARLHEYVSRGFLPAMAKYASGPSIVLEAVVAAHQPQVAVITGFESVEAVMDAQAKMRTDRRARKALDVLESGEEAPYESCSESLLEATDYSKDIIAPAAPLGPPRMFELRVYHSPTWRQLKALHRRFAGPEIKIFHRSGVFPILYASTICGGNMPNLTYLIPFDSLEAREKAWATFGADPEWIQVRKESVEEHGQIAPVIQASLFKATPYSPIR